MKKTAAKRFECIAGGDTAKYATLKFMVNYKGGRWEVHWQEPELTDHAKKLLERFGRFRVDVGNSFIDPHVDDLAFHCRTGLWSWGEVVEYVDSVRAQITRKFEELERRNVEFPDGRIEEFYINI